MIVKISNPQKVRNKMSLINSSTRESEMLLDRLQLQRLAEDKLCVPAKLHDFQWDGVAFLYRSHAALLADEMGLGKTVQTAVALALLLSEQNGINRALIVAPASLTINWMLELKTWAPSLVVRRVQGPARDRKAFYLLPIPVLVISYEQVRLDGLDRIPMHTFDIVILDEAQRVKNRNSTTALACRLLSRKRAWALSATPLENSRDDVASIVGFLDPAVNRDLPKTHFTKKLESLMLRRKKSDVRTELPPVIFQDLVLPLSKPQKERYNELWINRAMFAGGGDANKNHNIALLELITRLKIICNFDKIANTSSKLDALKEIFEGAGNASRVIVFSQFVKTLQWISDRIDLPHNLLTGSMPLPERQVVINRFKTSDTPRALLVSLKAGGVGLNLGEATHVVLFDRWWNPAVESQATYRAHRFDRNEPLHVVRFLVECSIEERIAEILKQKEGLFDDIIESTETTTQGFTKKELLRILGLSSGEISPQQHTLEENQGHD